MIFRPRQFATLPSVTAVAILSLAFALGTAPPAVAQVVSTEQIPTALVESGMPVQLELVSYRPTGAGPFPTVMFNHGSTGSGTDPALFTQTWSSPAIAGYFNQRGWMVVFPQRRGRGRSGGLYDEGFGPNRAAGYTCDPARSLAGVERALTDLDEVVRHLRTRSDVDARRLLIGGQSRGGILAIAYAGTRPGVFHGALNFVGGWMSDTCANPAAINTVTFVRGGAFAGPTVWLYGENDPFYSLAHSRSNHAAFAAAGGRGQLNVFNLGPGQSGHNVFLFPDRWGPSVETLLRELPAPAANDPAAQALANLSIRARVGPQPLIVGFVIGGSTTRQLILRGVGPALRQFGIANAAERPQFALFDAAGRSLMTVAAWAGDAVLAAAFATAGAFPLGAGSADAAALVELPSGSYTIHLTDTGGAERIVLGEIFSSGATGLANLSARVAVGEGDATAITGFIVGGNFPAHLLVRVAGPALASFGVGDALADPRLTVFAADGRPIASNDNWGAPESAAATAAEVAAAAAQTGAFAFPADSRDAATLLRLNPGAYTIHATGPSGGTGLVEIYSLPDNLRN